MDLSILIVSWNVADLLAACLNSIQTGADTSQLEVIVVDSASTDHSVAMIRERYPSVRLFPQEQNIGFTRGNNVALEQAQGRYVMLLNPDTVVQGDALQKLVRYLDQHPGVGIVGPHVLNEDGSTQSTRRRFPTLLTAIFESTWMQDYASKRLLDHFYVADQPDDGTFDVDWVQGCALMARREVYEKIGPLDASYVMFSEELDWCKRAKEAGWRVVYLGDAFITHYGGKSTEQVPTNKHIYFQQSKIRYFRKFHGRLAAGALRLFLVLSYLAQIVLEGIKALIGSKRAMRQERIRTYGQVVRVLVGL